MLQKCNGIADKNFYILAKLPTLNGAQERNRPKPRPASKDAGRGNKFRQKNAELKFTSNDSIFTSAATPQFFSLLQKIGNRI